MKDDLGFLRDVAEAQNRLLAQSPTVAREVARMTHHTPSSGVLHSAPRTPQPRTRLIHATFACLISAAAAAATFYWMPRHRSLTFGVAQERGQLGAAIAAPSLEPVAIDFSDGSLLKVAAGGRARVTHLDARGAVVQLERGHADVSVVHRPNASWRVDAGPFQVLVKGTEFSLDWEPSSERFGFQLHRGAVVIQGGCLATPRALKAGESLYTSCPAQGTAPAPDPHGSVAAETEASALPSPPQTAPAEPARAPASSAKDESPSWHRLAASGKFREALEAAERSGFDQEVGRANGEDLLTLGDAARLSGNSSRALQAYRASRERRPKGKRSAFAMGLVYFDQQHAYAEAARWFSLYLREQPGGALAEQAAGRLMESAAKAGDQSTARAEATRYLSDHPRGAYVDLARRLTGQE